MKKHGLALLLGIALLAPALSAYAHDRDDEHRSTNALEMSVIGLAVASAVGGGTYLAYRRKVRRG